MFLFSRKTKTPISTYSDSYRAPTSIKEVYKDPPLWAWEANKFVTPVSTGFGWRGYTIMYLDDWHAAVPVCSYFCFFFHLCICLFVC